VQKAMIEMIGQTQHQVLAFCDGGAALDCLRAERDVRAPLTNAQLADITGIELCAVARKLAGSRRPLFIGVMSSLSDYGLAARAPDDGADDFIRKPRYAGDLRARLRAADRLTLLQGQLIKFATTHPLTGLLNRRASFEDATARSQETDTGSPASAILFDIDHFKQINDTHGHEAGDVVLVAVSRPVMTAANAIAGAVCPIPIGAMSSVNNAEEEKASDR
jgi:two-component system, cell cycle response regulator